MERIFNKNQKFRLLEKLIQKTCYCMEVKDSQPGEKKDIYLFFVLQSLDGEETEHDK